MQRTSADVETKLREEWRKKLQEAVTRTRGPVRVGGRIDRFRGMPITLWPEHVVDGANGFVMVEIDGWDLHELYTVLVDSDGPEGCCAGCTKLPQGWCRTCDEQ